MQLRGPKHPSDKRKNIGSNPVFTTNGSIAQWQLRGTVNPFSQSSVVRVHLLPHVGHRRQHPDDIQPDNAWSCPSRGITGNQCCHFFGSLKQKKQSVGQTVKMSPCQMWQLLPAMVIENWVNSGKVRKEQS